MRTSMKKTDLVVGEMYFVKSRYYNTNLILEGFVNQNTALMYSTYTTTDVRTLEQVERRRYRNVNIRLIELPRPDEEL